jgi:hypothetical protein
LSINVFIHEKKGLPFPFGGPGDRKLMSTILLDKEMPCEAKYVPVKFPLKCLQWMHHLCLSDIEYGGQFFPSKESGECKLSCTDAKLIKGTALEDNNPDAKFYKGDNKAMKIKIAVTPLYEEVFKISPLCDSSDSINMFFHTHPLLLSPDAAHGQLSPPSIGDFFAHAVLSNYRNYKQNGIINMPILMTREGLYHYNILPTRFDELVTFIDDMVTEGLAAGKWTERQRRNIKIGELPGDIVNQLKAEVFGSLRGPTQTFQMDMAAWCQKHPQWLGLEGAYIIKDTRLDSASTGPVCPFDHAVGEDWFRQYAANNTLTQALHKLGFFYHYVPAPFTRDIIIGGPCELRRSQRQKNNRQKP